MRKRFRLYQRTPYDNGEMLMVEHYIVFGRDQGPAGPRRTQAKAQALAAALAGSSLPPESGDDLPAFDIARIGAQCRHAFLSSQPIAEKIQFSSISKPTMDRDNARPSVPHWRVRYSAGIVSSHWRERMSIFSGKLGFALALAAVCIGARIAHAQAAPITNSIPGWPVGF